MRLWSFYASDSSVGPGTALKIVSLETSGIPRRIAVAAILRSALCSRFARAWPIAAQSARSWAHIVMSSGPVWTTSAR